MRHERWLYHGSVTCDNCLLCCHICSHIVTLRQLNTVAASLNDCPSAGKTYPAHWPKAARAPNPPTPQAYIADCHSPAYVDAQFRTRLRGL